VHGRDRTDALTRLSVGLGAFAIEGVTTNLAFLRALAAHPRMASGDIDTGFIERELATLAPPVEPPAASAAIAAPEVVAGVAALAEVPAPAPLVALDLAAACAAALAREQEGQGGANPRVSPWDRGDGWTLVGRRSRRLGFRRGGERHEATLWYRRDGLALELGGAAERLQYAPRENGVLDLCLGDAPERVSVAWSGRDLYLTTPRGRLDLHWIDPFAGEHAAAAAASRTVAPMPGTVTRILAEAGAALRRGAALLVLEAMKMEHTLRAPADGRLAALKCAVGDVVQEGAELAEFVANDT
jgi:3-methylcrotonyl-CoA carboxylase alpha subunit